MSRSVSHGCTLTVSTRKRRKQKLLEHFQKSSQEALLNSKEASHPTVKGSWCSPQRITFCFAQGRNIIDDCVKRMDVVISSCLQAHQLSSHMQAFVVSLPPCCLNNCIWDKDRMRGGVGEYVPPEVSRKTNRMSERQERDGEAGRELHPFTAQATGVAADALGIWKREIWTANAWHKEMLWCGGVAVIDNKMK